jgi:hypothetical protein
MVVNLRNPNYDPYTYYPPECPSCLNKPCKSCPLPLYSPKDRHTTLRQLIDKVAAQPLDRAFRDNGNLYLTAAEQYQMSRELNRLPAEVKDEESKGDDE